MMILTLYRDEKITEEWKLKDPNRKIKKLFNC